MKILKGLTVIAFALLAWPLFLVGWLSAVIWTPISGGFWWGNRHVDALLDVKSKAWKVALPTEE